MRFLFGKSISLWRVGDHKIKNGVKTESAKNENPMMPTKIVADEMDSQTSSQLAVSGKETGACWREVTVSGGE